MIFILLLLMTASLSMALPDEIHKDSENSTVEAVSCSKEKNDCEALISGSFCSLEMGLCICKISHRRQGSACVQIKCHVNDDCGQHFYRVHPTIRLVLVDSTCDNSSHSCICMSGYYADQNGTVCKFDESKVWAVLGINILICATISILIGLAGCFFGWCALDEPSECQKRSGGSKGQVLSDFLSGGPSPPGKRLPSDVEPTLKAMLLADAKSKDAAKVTSSVSRGKKNLKANSVKVARV